MSENVEVPLGHFFLPGPTEVDPEVAEAQTRQMIGHRGAAIQKLMSKLQDGLKAVFQTERPVVISASSATGLMEAGVRNGVTDGRVLSLVNGAFSARFSVISKACGHDTDVWSIDWGKAHDPSELAARLDAEDYQAVTITHSETSTGVIQDLEAIAEVAAGHRNTLLLVDSVTGVGAVEIRPDDWGIDFLVTGSQKALALPPGLAFGVASDAMMQRSAVAPRKGVYFDLIELHDKLEGFETPATPAVSLLYALEVQLERMLEEGMKARWQRHLEMQNYTLGWIDSVRSKGLDIRPLAEKGHRSPSVTCVELPQDRSGSEVVAAMKAEGWVLGTGYGKLKEDTVRIGHMGDHTVGELTGLLEALEGVLVG